MNTSANTTTPPHVTKPSLATILQLLGVSLRLGLTSFGGPIAHLAFFREEYVQRRKWLDDTTYADLVALCQFLPGPASSQVGISIGMMRAGFWGGVASWVGFTLPSALALMLFAFFLQGYDVAGAGWLRGLLVVAVAIVAHAVWGMATKLTPDRQRATMAIVTAIAALLAPTAATQVVLIVVAGLVGWLALPQLGVVATPGVAVPLSRRSAIVAWVLFFGLLVLLPVVRHVITWPSVALADSFYRVGSLVFGGGHVVLPLLRAEVVGPGWISDTNFLAGYGAAQAVPGPLFTFASYLGATIGGWTLALVALVAIFAPSFLLVAGALPFWDTIRRYSPFQAALRGVNAAVVGILLAALYDPIWTKAIHTPADFALALAALAMLRMWKVPAWAVVLFAATMGAVMGGWV